MSWTHSPGAPAFTIRFDGRRLVAAPGQTVAAVLWAAGLRAWRTTRRAGAPRGLFCGIGACFDCLVTIDGVPDQRACLVPARPGMIVSSGEGSGMDGAVATGSGVGDAL
jgi:predicted molibdopterin-dependent oxidoreductase YjgC